jgi:hypothetical protein
LCRTLQKLLNPRGFKEVILCRATGHSSPCSYLWQKANSYFWPRPSI